jgi:hypothetical protein
MPGLRGLKALPGKSGNKPLFFFCHLIQVHLN